MKVMALLTGAVMALWMSGCTAMSAPPAPDDLLSRARAEMTFLLSELSAANSRRDWSEERPEQDEFIARSDPWGTPYKVWPDVRSAEGGGQVVRLVIESAGPDKVFGSADDLARHSAFMRSGGLPPGPPTRTPERTDSE